MQIKDKVFIVTGGASGLGGVTSAWLAERGARVVIADLNRPSQGLSDSVKFITTDVSDSVSAKAAVDFACDQFGSLHGLINCAGVAPAEKVLGKEGPHRLESFSRAIAINLIGSFNMLRLAAQAISDRAEAETEETAGVIINTASVAAYDGQIGQAAYSASKGGIVGMTLPIARDLSRDGIRVVTIAPGLFETPLLAALPEDAKASLGRQVPFPPRLGRPDEYAQMAKHIVENCMLNGETIRLDGAIRMAPR